MSKVGIMMSVNAMSLGRGASSMLSVHLSQLQKQKKKNDYVKKPAVQPRIEPVT